MFPLLLFSLWLLANKAVFGWFLWPHNAFFIANAHLPWWGFAWIGKAIFLSQGKLLFSACALGTLLSSRGREALLRLPWLSWGLLLLSTVLFYWLQCSPEPFSGRDYLPLSRYYLYLQPLILIAAIIAIRETFQREVWTDGLVLAFSLGSLLFSHPSTVQANGEDSYHQRSMVLAQQEAARYLEVNHPSAQILIDSFTAWNRVLSDPVMGYVSQPLNTMPLQAWLAAGNTCSSTTRNTLLFSALWTVEAQHSARRPKEIGLFAEAQAALGQAKLLASFERSPERVSIYRCGPVVP